MFPRLLPGLVALLTVASASANTFVVTNINDDGAGSLRQAISDANANPNSGGVDTIQFDIPGDGVQTIVVASALPEITDPVLIDGWTQPGWNGAPLVELSGQADPPFDGLVISGGGTTVRGLIMNGFQDAIRIQNNGSNIVQGCYLGTDKTGHQAVPNDRGVHSLTTSNNLVGGISSVERNVISGNRLHGIYFQEPNQFAIQSSGNRIQGNYVGTDVTGTIALPNCTAAGVSSLSAVLVISKGAKVGGPETGAGNLVSGNASRGVYVYGSDAVIAGNVVGTDVSGSVALPNKGGGIFMGSLGGTLGGTTPAARNLVSGNTGYGIQVESSDGEIQGNFVGTDATGKLAIPNSGVGVAIAGARNVFGGNTAGAANLVSGNGGPGLVFYTGFSTIGPVGTSVPAVDNVVQGNFVGTDITGTTALPNAAEGVVITGSGNRVGGAAPGAGNLISGNGGTGILATGATTMKIQGNLIGTQADGVTPLGNHGHGIASGDSGGVVGSAAGTDVDPANIIAFNLLTGINFTGSGAVSGALRISANSIHDNGALGIDLGSTGATANDTGDSDTGPNQLQNFPVISSASGFQGKLTIYGTLNSTPSNTFTLEFFANSAPDNSGYGEGRVFLGQAKVTTASSGDVAFNVTFPLPSNVTAVSATAIDGNGNTSEFAADAAISPTAPGPPPTSPTPVYLPTHSLHLLNIATRMKVETGDHALIAGFIVVGSESKKVIVRGLGPSLNNFGVPGVLANPVLELYDASGNLLVSNDDWRTSQQSEIQMSGVAPTNDSESAVVATLSPGNYTAILRGKNGGTGVGLVDVYDLAQGAVSHLGNVSSRGFVGTGDNVIIGGFIVGDNGGGTIVVLRAIGPSLSAAGIPDPLLDPYLELRNSNGAVVDFNDDWHSAFGADQVIAAHLAPGDDRESALYKNLAPGNYTAIVKGKTNSAVGVATVEVYDLGPQ